MTGGDLSKPLPKPRGGQGGPRGQPLLDDFSTLLKLGRKGNLFRPGPAEQDHIRIANGRLVLKASGKAPSNSSPLLMIAGDQAYECECNIEVAQGGTAGLVLFCDDRLYCGLGLDDTRFVTHQYGIERGRPANPHGRRMKRRIVNKRHIGAVHTSGDDGRTWRRFDCGMELSGYHHNVCGGFLLLRPGLYSAGAGEARFRDFRFRVRSFANSSSLSSRTGFQTVCMPIRFTETSFVNRPGRQDGV